MHGVVTLGITNIRVIKKIERMAHRLAAILEPFREEILTQAVTACLQAGWSVFERDHAPSMEFVRSEEHTSELQSLMRISYAVFCLTKKNTNKIQTSKQSTRIEHTSYTTHIYN